MKNDPIWKQRNGHGIHLSKMTTSHIKASLNMLKRKGFISPKTLYFYMTCTEPNGEMAQHCFDQEFDRILDQDVTEWIDIFEDELKLRLKEKK